MLGKTPGTVTVHFLIVIFSVSKIFFASSGVNFGALFDELCPKMYKNANIAETQKKLYIFQSLLTKVIVGEINSSKIENLKGRFKWRSRFHRGVFEKNSCVKVKQFIKNNSPSL